MNNKLARILVVGTVFALIMFSGCSQEEKQNQPEQQTKTEQKSKNLAGSGQFIGSEAPGFELQNLSGEKVTLEQFSGKVVLLNFWATWCPPCRKEIPDLIEMYSENKDDGLEIVGITLNSGPPRKIQEFVDKNNINYHILTNGRDKTAGLAKKYDNITGVPTTFIIDKNGIVQHKWVGPRPKEKFMEEISKYL